jgi:hypothetical protein
LLLLKEHLTTRMDFDTLLVFIPACFALNMTFGPSNLLALTNGVREGVGEGGGRGARAHGRLCEPDRDHRGRARRAAGDIGAGLLGRQMGGRGLSDLSRHQARALACGRSPRKARAMAHRPLASLARQEFLVGIGNPKAIVIFTAFFPQFVDPDRYLASFAVLGALFLVFDDRASEPLRGPCGGVPAQRELP